ncbi:hypothetical protein [Microcoleus asticus]|uniref:Alpha/beta hydrolase fold-3 domain-containing protein n=1 Tax=Microcoleus asticus IPMA8 TaxID=2563858 RepID=A0ABX2CWJ9_9CYAN|nr:hypothetical protein [Microcoleus asticus]NQE34508.1 hypothetical protein [Microcoleus asticus IPMA8]
MNARNNPTPTDAVMGVLAKRGQPAVEMVGDLSHQLIPGPAGDLLARIYKLQGQGPFPVLVYFHGGWVIANLDTYDSSSLAHLPNLNLLINNAGISQRIQLSDTHAGELEEKLRSEVDIDCIAPILLLATQLLPHLKL